MPRQAERTIVTAGPGDARRTTYDSQSRIATQDVGPDTSSFLTYAIPTYNAANEVTSVSYPNGTGQGGNATTVTLGYDSFHRLTTTTAKQGTTLITSDQVSLSQSGRVVDETIDGTDTHAGNNFTYDAIGRLIDAWVPGHHYTYGFGTTSCYQTASGKDTNRTTVTDNGTTTASYCYNSADRLISTTDSRYGTVAYDAHGNVTTLGSDTMTYDIADRHMSTTSGGTTVTYVRDADDRIVSRTAAGVTTHYGYGSDDDSAEVVLDASNAVVDQEVPLLGGVMVDIRGGTKTFLYSNIHGDIAATANASGTKQGSTVNYDPFGANRKADLPGCMDVTNW